MSEFTVKAIVIRAADYRDNDKLVRLFTLDRGVLSAVMRGVKKPKAKMKFGAQPFAFCEYQLVERGGYYTVTGCAAVEDTFLMAADPDRYVAGGVILECADCAASFQPAPEVFVTLLTALKAMMYGGPDPYLAAVWFMVRLFSLTGYETKYPSAGTATPAGVMGLAAVSTPEELAAAAPPAAAVKAALTRLVRAAEERYDCRIRSAELIA